MSLETPERIRNLQRKLYCKAKAEPAFRFYMLYDRFVGKASFATPTSLPAPMRVRPVWTG